MTSPPVVATAPHPARPALKRTNTEGLDPVEVRQLVNAGQWLAQRWNLQLRRARIRELAIRYLRDGRADIDFADYFLGYADPTGEAAVRNVLAETAS